MLSILEDRRLTFSGFSSCHVFSDSVTKVYSSFTLSKMVLSVSLYYTWSQLKHCRVGQTVRVISDVSRLRQRHIDSHIWREKMVTVS